MKKEQDNVLTPKMLEQIYNHQIQDLPFDDKTKETITQIYNDLNSSVLEAFNNKILCNPNPDFLDLCGYYLTAFVKTPFVLENDKLKDYTDIVRKYETDRIIDVTANFMFKKQGKFPLGEKFFGRENDTDVKTAVSKLFNNRQSFTVEDFKKELRQDIVFMDYVTHCIDTVFNGIENLAKIFEALSNPSLITINLSTPEKNMTTYEAKKVWKKHLEIQTNNNSAIILT